MAERTREFFDAGVSNSSQMGAPVDDKSGYRTQIRNDGDTTLMLRTKGGEWQITGEEEATPALYLETGQLECTSNAPLDPHRDDPAKWHFLDIATADDWLGLIQTSTKYMGKQAKKQPTPIDTGILREACDSLAVGYPRSAKAEKDYQSRQDYSPAMLAKKLVMGLFPASMFPGKLRLFMQAQYGARLSKSAARGFYVDIVGTMPVLKYRVGDKDNTVMQFGFWGHNSQGLFSASDGTYWMLTVKQGSTSTTVEVCPITLWEETAPLVQWLKDGALTLSAKAKEQAEAYIFAHCTIQANKTETVATFAHADVGGPIAYGWKFNWDGSKARQVSVTVVGTTERKYSSTDVELTFTYTPVAGQKPRAAWFTVQRATSGSGLWLDGWGQSILWVPSDEPPTLEMYSLAATRDRVAPMFNFSGVPIYGYYKRDDWVPVTITHNADAGPFPKYEQEDTNLQYDPYNNYQIKNNWLRYEYGVRPADEGFTYEGHRIHSRDTWAYDVGGVRVEGHLDNEDTVKVTCTVIVGSEVNYGTPPSQYSTNWYPACNGTAYWLPAEPPQPVPQVPPDGFYIDMQAHINPIMGTTSVRIEEIPGNNRFSKVVLVVPCYDCAAVYVAKKTENSQAGTVRDIVQYSSMQWVKYAYVGLDHPVTGPYGPFRMWAVGATTGGWYGDSPVTTYNPSPPVATPVTSSQCWNTHVSGVAGTPGVHAGSSASYETLFAVDYHVPYYNAGMWVFTGAGSDGRYTFSDGPKAPSTANHTTFIGWA